MMTGCTGFFTMDRFLNPNPANPEIMSNNPARDRMYRIFHDG